MFRRKKNDFDDDDFWYDFDDEESAHRSPSRRLGLFITLAALFIVIAVLAFFWNRATRPVESQSPPTAPVIGTVLPAIANEVDPSSPTLVALTAATAVSPPITQPESPTTYNPDALAQQMLILINQSRADNNLSPVAWDTAATLAGQLHAEDMAQFNYFSHWNRDGLGPDHRYTLIGGQHTVIENLHAFSYTYDNGQGAPSKAGPKSSKTPTPVS